MTKHNYQLSAALKKLAKYRSSLGSAAASVFATAAPQGISSSCVCICFTLSLPHTDLNSSAQPKAWGQTVLSCIPQLNAVHTGQKCWDLQSHRICTLKAPHLDLTGLALLLVSRKLRFQVTVESTGC